MRQKFFLNPFGISGDQTIIPDPTQVSGLVSFQSGWPFDYQRAIGTDPLALPIDRSTMNWLMFIVTSQLQQYQEFGFPEWINSTDNGGSAFAYDFGAIVRYSVAGTPPFTTYISVVAGAGTNTSTPGADANWRVWNPTSLYQATGIPTGAINGSNTNYTLPQTPAGSVPLYVNGLFQIYGVDYTISGTTITYLNTPLIGLDTIAFGEYRY